MPTTLIDMHEKRLESLQRPARDVAERLGGAGRRYRPSRPLGPIGPPDRIRSRNVVGRSSARGSNLTNMVRIVEKVVSADAPPSFLVTIATAEPLGADVA